MITPLPPDNRYQLMPALSPEERAALKEDIRQRGILVPVVVDEDGNTIDGHYRRELWLELRAEGEDIPEIRYDVRAGLSDAEKELLSVGLNMLRRHLDREQREQLHATLRERGWTIRQIAAATGYSIGTVHSDLTPDVQKRTDDEDANEPNIPRREREGSASAAASYPSDRQERGEPPAEAYAGDRPNEPATAPEQAADEAIDYRTRRRLAPSDRADLVSQELLALIPLSAFPDTLAFDDIITAALIAADQAARFPLLELLARCGEMLARVHRGSALNPETGDYESVDTSDLTAAITAAIGAPFEHLPEPDEDPFTEEPDPATEDAPDGGPVE